jgi:hypothetical protein
MNPFLFDYVRDIERLLVIKQSYSITMKRKLAHRECGKLRHKEHRR